MSKTSNATRCDSSLNNSTPVEPGRRVRMMDGTPDTWVGWQRWHGLIRAAVLLGPDPDRWLHVTQVDNPNNPGLADNRLAELRAAWMSLGFEKLEWAFANASFSRAKLGSSCRCHEGPRESCDGFCRRADLQL